MEETQKFDFTKKHALDKKRFLRFLRQRRYYYRNRESLNKKVHSRRKRLIELGSFLEAKGIDKNDILNFKKNQENTILPSEKKN